MGYNDNEEEVSDFGVAYKSNLFFISILNPENKTRWWVWIRC